MKHLLPLLSLFLLHFNAISQNRLYDATNSIPILNTTGDTLQFPFIGGINSCQFGGIDLDLDGIEDMVVFDRHGNRVLPFLNTGNSSGPIYKAAPEYTLRLPAIRDWVQMVDYDLDGRTDLFTYTTGGIKVFRNTSDTGLSFNQVTFPYLLSLQGASYTNILVTYADYPVIRDVDGDGDIDILCFWGLGSFVDWHRNRSVENYGNSDSLVFEKASGCWGHFAEAGESNRIILDTCMGSISCSTALKEAKHTGSTMFLSDLNGDELPDLALGDVDFPMLSLLMNGGTQSDPTMVSVSSSFPDSIHPVNLASFPAISELDINNDGRKDILVSPFDPSLTRSAPSQSSWLYSNEGTSPLGRAIYTFIQADFLQNEMLDFGAGSYPLIFDYDGDGRKDLLVGNFGYLDSSWYTPSTGLQCTYSSALAYLRNVGTLEQAVFEIIDTDLLGLSALQMQSLIPAAGDVDGDGDMDLLCGNSKGKFVFLRNQALPGSPPDFILEDPAFRLLDAGDFSAPHVIDLDKDGLQDIVSGNRNGKLSYFRNIGQTGNPQYALVTDSLGGVDITRTSQSYYGYSVPFFMETKGQLKLLVGSEYGEIYVFTGIEDNLEGKFSLEGSLEGVSAGWRSSIALAHLDSDTLPEVLIGNYSGGLNLYHGIIPRENGIFEAASGIYDGLVIVPNPAREEVLIDISNRRGKYLQNYAISLYKPDGKLVLTVKIPEFPFKLNVNSLTPGLYLVKAVCREDILSGKIVVVH